MSSFSYCPYCGSLLSHRIVENTKRLVCENGHVVYQNSKPSVVAIITDGGSRVFLTRRSIAPYKGHWDIPGGFLETGEHPKDGLSREIQEELGIPIHIEDFLGHFISKYGEDGEYVLNMVYVVRADVSNAVAQDDIDDFRWFELGDLPKKLGFPMNREVLELWRERTEKG